ncbi:MAG: hypothetical protein LWX83_18235 [Anaerolineae bacterium]|nr:hypothetical protein [Anaerolineae bacterium]
MPYQPLLPGLIFDEKDSPVEVAYIGNEPCYVVDDFGFKRHVPSVEVDRQVLKTMMGQVKGNETLIAEQTAKMLGQVDIFTKAMIENQLKHMDEQIETILHTGLPENARAYMGMMGFRVIINVHGEVVRVDQPASISGDEGE